MRKSKGDVFVEHILSHLMKGDRIICKICEKDVDTIYAEFKKEHEDFFDYEYIGQCEYEVGAGFSCGEPAIANGWWDDGDKIKLCKYHFDFIIAKEKEKDAERKQDGQNLL